MRGREAELERIARSLGTVEDGRGSVVLVEGDRGSGKSRLLQEATRSAAARGFDVMHAEATELLRLIPLAPPVAAIGEHGDQTSRAFTGLDLRWSRQVAQLRGRLARRAAQRPLLVVLDDLHWAAPESLLTLRILATQLAGYPILWLLSQHTHHHDARGSQLYAQLLAAPANAILLQLGPLTVRAAGEMAADLLGATPTPELNALMGAADGNPAALTELAGGLIDEGVVACSNGKARLVGAGTTRLPPQRFRVLMRQRMDALSPPTARMLEVAAVLGMSWLPDDVGEMLGTSSAQLLPSFREALAVRLLVSTADTMTFRHELLWRSIVQSVPPPVRAALHRQAARMLLDRGSPASDAAVHLAFGARPGDAEAVRVLRNVATQVMGSSPHTAAELTSRGLELVDRQDPVRSELTAVLVEALTRAGDLERAIKIAREASPCGPAHSLQRLLSTALLLDGDVREAFAVADSALQAHTITAGERGALELNRLAALAALGDSMTEDTAARCGGSRIGVLTILATARWQQGRFTEGLRLARDAARAVDSGEPFPWHLDPRPVLAAMLVQSRKEGEAETVIAALVAHVAQTGLNVLAAVPHALYAQLHLAAGRLDEAQAQAHAALAESATAFSPIASAALAAAAVRRGDLVGAAEHAEQLTRRRPALWQGQATWLHTMITGQECETLPGPAILAEEPAAAAWFVRTAVAAGNEGRAVAVLHAMADADNTAAIDHARGVYGHDQAALTRAMESHIDGWARASAAEDLAVLLTSGDRDAAVMRLDQALAGYRAAGAERDAARVRRRLRDLGVRRRHWRNADRPASGWESLTDTERNVAGLVIQGLTNKQIAAQLFLSPHTVGFHLRQIFRKLDIHSRTELTRFIPDAAST